MWRLWVASFFALPGSLGEEKAAQVTGILGESVSFHLEISTTVESIFYLLDNGSRINTIAMATSNPPCELKVFLRQYEGRMNVSEDCQRLQIADLHQEDSGTYIVHVFNKQKPLKLFFRLQVLRSHIFCLSGRLSGADLKVSCAKGHLTDGTDAWHLHCFAEDGEDDDAVEYSWASTGRSEIFSGKSLALQRSTQSDDLNITCVVQNAAGNTSRSFSLKQACDGNMDKPSGPFSETTLGVTITIMILVKVVINACVFAKWTSCTE